MKKVFIAIAVGLLSVSTILGAGLKIKEHSPLKMEESVYHPILSPDGNHLLYSQDDYRGLKMYDLNNNDITEISDNIGAGFNASFSPDGKSVYFKNSKIIDKLRNTNLMEHRVADKSAVEVLPMSREKAEIATFRNKVMIKSGTHRIGIEKTSVMAYNDYNKIVVIKAGTDREISPVADVHSYMNVSVSPDGSKILFSEPYKGVFTCNLDGSNLKSYGRGANPKWASDDTILMIKSKDDGYMVLESRLYSVNLNTGAAVALTGEDKKVDDYSVAPLIGKITYSTDLGSLYIIQFEIAR